MTVEDDDQQTLMDEVVTRANMAQLRHQVQRMAARAGLDSQRSEAFTLAVNEAVTNAIRHAGGSGEVAVIKDDERRLIAEVSDAGPGIPCSVTITLPPPEAIGGRGMWLVEELADHVEVRSDRGGTTVRLEMSIE
jgi:serine/threonine-protein kinase RsbW